MITLVKFEMLISSEVHVPVKLLVRYTLFWTENLLLVVLADQLAVLPVTDVVPSLKPEKSSAQIVVWEKPLIVIIKRRNRIVKLIICFI